MKLLKVLGLGRSRKTQLELSDTIPKSSAGRHDDSISLVHELETYHAELQAQNQELSESQHQLLRSNDRFQILYDFAPVGFATFSRLGNILDLNLTLAGYLESERESVRNTPFVCWLARGESKAFVRHLNRVFLTHEKQIVELVLKQISGRNRIVRVETVITPDTSGGFFECKSAVIDISYEKQVETELKRSYKNLEQQVEVRTQELRLTLQELSEQIKQKEDSQRIAGENEEKYKRLFSSVSEAIVLYESETKKIIDVNQSAVDLYGYSADEFKRMRFQDLSFVDDRNSLPNNGGGLTCDYSPTIAFHRTSHGNLLPVELSTGSFGFNEKEVVFAIVHDMQERMAAEARLKLAANVFEYANDAIMVADASYKIVMVNQAFSRISGYGSEEAIGRDSRTFLESHSDNESPSEKEKDIDGRCQYQREVLHKHKSGAIYHAWENLSYVKNSNGSIAYCIYIFSDISQLKEAEAKSTYLAHHDALTRLPNRLLFGARLEQSLQLAKRSDANLALLFLDLDRFKYINDTLGHAYGDRLLREIAKRIESCVREQDTVARFGGDEFTVLLSVLHHEQEAANLAEKILYSVSLPVKIDDAEIVVSTSIGISLFPRDGTTATDLIKAADVAMYCAKDRGRNKFEFYTRELTARSEERLQLEHEIRDNLTTGNFFLCYQPQLQISSGKVTGVEALLRWRHADGTVSTPEKIIAVAEESSLILDLDAWVLRTACTQAALWYRSGVPCFKVAINFSAMNLLRDGFAEKVRRVLDELSLPAGWIELEVTESVLQSGESVIGELESLKALGVTLAIDDFGTGYSSLSSLKHLPIDRIKIDKSFITDVPDSKSDAGITQAIITMGHNLNLKVIAEGVENDSQWEFLRAAGCDQVQGFRFGHPEHAALIPSYLGKVFSMDGCPLHR